MEFSLDQRTASLSVGEFSDFLIGPRDGGDSPQGLWRAQLGTHWHQQLRTQTAAETPAAHFEVAVEGRVFHHGWTLTLTGRIDQLLPAAPHTLLREIKTVTRPLPASEEELRAAYPAYFAQLATYLALKTLAATPAEKFRGELLFIEAGSGLSQTVPFSPADENPFRVQLERVTEFLNLRLRARDRLRTLRFQPAFPALRPGQETVQADLAAAARAHPVLLFEAPTGFGKTGALLEHALTRLRDGALERILYLTGKSTGQLQVVQTLARMTALPSGAHGVTAWHVRNKREHCIHHTYHCSREVCPHLASLETKWPRSGLSRFWLLDTEPHDIDTLRAAGRAASVCPYEITRAALAYHDVWIGDFNYVFSPSSRRLFHDQPGFDPARTLLLVDEAHNLPSRVADVYTHRLAWPAAAALAETLHRTRAPARLCTAWDQWTRFLQQLPPADALDLATEDDARHLLDTLATLIPNTPVDTLALGPDLAEQLWEIPALSAELAQLDMPRLWWSPQPGELTLTCLDAATAIGPALRAYGAVVLASATLTPADTFAAACGLDAPPPDEPRQQPQTPNSKPQTPAPARLGALNQRDTRRLYTQLTTGADLLRVEETRATAAPRLVHAHTPWRETAYDVAIDLRVDTSYRERARHHPATARTIETLRAATPGPVAIFFPSYRYAEDIQTALAASALRVALQPRIPDLAKQTAWVEQSLAAADALFLVLGSSFAEGIDMLGGRVAAALVVGPALPEVNPVQKARLAALAHLGRDESFRRVYQAPGIQKVNQALGRLVRAPGQRARVLLHCRRFAEPAYAALLAPEYRSGHPLATDADLATWLAR